MKERKQTFFLYHGNKKMNAFCAGNGNRRPVRRRLWSTQKSDAAFVSEARRALRTPVSVRIHSADLVWMRKNSKRIDAVVFMLDGEGSSEKNHAFAARSAAAHFKVDFHIETTVTEHNCDVCLTESVLRMNPLSWRIVRGLGTEANSFAQFVSLNYRATAEMCDVSVDWSLIQTDDAFSCL